MVRNELLVNKGQSKELNVFDPIGYTNNFDESLVMLVHNETNTFFINVDLNSDIKKVYHMINFIIRLPYMPKVELFIGCGKHPYESIVIMLLDKFKIPYELKESFVNSNYDESLGYNYITGEYYSIMIEEDMPTFRVAKTKKLEKKYK